MDDYDNVIYINLEYTLVSINQSRHQVLNFLTITFVLVHGKQSGVDETLRILILGPNASR